MRRLLLVVLLAGCTASTPIPVVMELESPEFFDGEPMPAKHGCDGAGVAPALLWHPLPNGTTHTALSMIDPDAPRGDFVHWLWWDVPASITFTPEGFRPELNGGTRGRTSTGGLDYVPACPPEGDGPHRYRFTVYALDAPLGLAEGSDRAAFDAAVKERALGRGTLTGTFERPA